MVSCRRVNADLVAWCDGELSPERAKRIADHLSICAACAREAQHTRAAIEWQKTALTDITAVEQFDTQALQMKLRRALASDPEPPLPWWAWLTRPVALAGAVALVAVVVFFSVVGGPKAVLIPLGVEPPPVAVSSEPELFENYQLIQHLDALENFDTVESVPLDEDQTLHEG